MPHARHSSRFDHLHNIGWGVQIVELFIMQLSPFPCYFVPLRTKILFSIVKIVYCLKLSLPLNQHVGRKGNSKFVVLLTAVDVVLLTAVDVVLLTAEFLKACNGVLHAGCSGSAVWVLWTPLGQGMPELSLHTLMKWLLHFVSHVGGLCCINSLVINHCVPVFRIICLS